MDFTYKELRGIYDLFRQNGYRFSFFDDYDPKGTVFLRHDVDCCISKALEMALFENSLGLASAFFIQPDNDFYNPFSARSLEMVNKIVSLGHKIGLHISPSNCKDQESLMQYIEHTYNYLSEFFPVERIFSFHRPGSFDGWQFIEVPGFVNTYHSKYFKEIYYFSDSNRREFLIPDFFSAPSTGRSIQFLTHPIWWSKEGFTPEKVCKNLFLEKEEEIRRSLKENIRLFASLLQKRRI